LPIFGSFSDTCNWEEASGRPRTPWMNYISHLAWEHHRIPQEELENVAGEKDVWDSLLDRLPSQPDLRKVEYN